MKKGTIETIVWIFAIIVMSALIVKLVVDDSGFSCSKCQVRYKSQLPASQEFSTANLPAQLIFDEFTKGRCAVRWDDNTGFHMVRELINISR